MVGCKLNGCKETLFSTRTSALPAHGWRSQISCVMPVRGLLVHERPVCPSAGHRPCASTRNGRRRGAIQGACQHQQLQLYPYALQSGIHVQLTRPVCSCLLQPVVAPATGCPDKNASAHACHTIIMRLQVDMPEHSLWLKHGAVVVAVVCGYLDPRAAIFEDTCCILSSQVIFSVMASCFF